MAVFSIFILWGAHIIHVIVKMRCGLAILDRSIAFWAHIIVTIICVVGCLAIAWFNFCLRTPVINPSFVLIFYFWCFAIEPLTFFRLRRAYIWDRIVVVKWGLTVSLGCIDLFWLGWGRFRAFEVQSIVSHEVTAVLNFCPNHRNWSIGTIIAARIAWGVVS